MSSSTLTKKVHNFAAGPAILPAEVLKQAAEACINFDNLNLSLLEISHRSKNFDAVMAMYHDLAPALWLVDFTNVLVISDRVENVITRPIGIEFENVRFKK